MRDDGEMLQRVLPCVSTPAQSRSAAHATKCQFITIPWGNPREAKPNPRVRSKPSLEHSTAEGMIAVFRCVGREWANVQESGPRRSTLRPYSRSIPLKRRSALEPSHLL